MATTKASPAKRATNGQGAATAVAKAVRDQQEARFAELEQKVATLDAVVKKLLVKLTMAEIAPQIQQQATQNLQQQIEQQLEQNGYDGII